MNIRIDFNSNGSKTVVHIAGRLAGSTVAQLKMACDPIEEPFVIDLSNLLYADDEGISTIRALANRDTQIRGASPFVRFLLDNAPIRRTEGGESKPT